VTAPRGRSVLEWVLAEVAPGRLMPWLAVAYGVGIVVYFTADREPAWWAVIALTAAGTAVAILARRRAVSFPLPLGFAACAAGFATGTLRTKIVTPLPRIVPAPSWWSARGRRLAIARRLRS